MKFKGTIAFAPGIILPEQFIALSPAIHIFFLENGWELKVCKMPSAGYIKDRAADLLPQLDDIQAKAKGEFHIIGHSCGGLDARLALEDHSITPKSLTTICTPHGGSPVADAVMEGKTVNNSFQAAAHDLTTMSMLAFNDGVMEREDISYASIGAAEPVIFGELNPTWHLFNGDNDGMVSVVSSKYGKYLGTVPCGHIFTVNPMLYWGHSFWRFTFSMVFKYLDSLD